MVVGALTLLGRRLRTLTTWAEVRPHLKTDLLKEMLEFDAAACAEPHWADSIKATEGLTSDEVHRKGSLAVQAMLRWLEVTRLARREAIAAAVARLGGDEPGGEA